MNAADIPLKMALPFAASPESGTSRVVPVTPSVEPGAASFQKGFTAINQTPVSLGGIPPFGQDVNGLFNVITAWLQWTQAGAPIAYDDAFQTEISGYPLGALVMSATTAGRYWLSTADANATNPDTGGAGWISVENRFYTYAGNPNTHVAGSTGGTNFPPDFCWDITNAVLWVCTATGNAAAAVWSQAPLIQSYLTATGTNTLTVTPVVTAVDGRTVRVMPVATNTAAAKLNATGLAIDLVRSDGQPVEAGDIVLGAPFTAIYDSATSEWRMLSPAPSQFAGAGLTPDADGALTVDIDGLSSQPTPASNDEVMIWSVGESALKKTDLNQIALALVFTDALWAEIFFQGMM